MISDLSNLGANDGKTAENTAETGLSITVSGAGAVSLTTGPGAAARSSSSLIIPQSALTVPHGTVALTACGLVTDVRAYLAQRTPVPRWEQEEPLFRRLPIDQRAAVRRMQASVLFVLGLATGRNKLSVQAACERALAIYAEFRPLKTYRGKYDAWLKAQDWLVLVNRAKAGPDWTLRSAIGLPDEFLDYVAARMGDFKRGDAGEQAILSIRRQWRTGRDQRGQSHAIPGYADGWETRTVNLEPAGWSSSNIRRQLKARAKFTRAVKALRHHGAASARDYLPQVHGTREGLRFLELCQFDDVRCDFRVIDTVRGQICDLWLLVARDVATTMLLGFGMRPALARDDGSQEHLKLQDMKQLCGWLLETYGLPPWAMEWLLENGTATLSEAVRAALAEMLGDRITFRMASMIGGRNATGYLEKRVGNSKAKAMLESLNRLQHMMTSCFPGQIGMTYGHRPAELIDREREAIDIWRNHRPEDREHLIYPVLTIPQAREKLFEMFRQQNQRTDHTCEGFERVVEMFDGTNWVPATTVAATRESSADDSQPRVRARMETPLERAAKLVQQYPGEWSRVAPEVMVSFYEHTQRRRPVEQNGEIEFTHEGKILRFAPPAPDFALPPETTCLCYFNPDDPRFLTLTDGRGGILGTWLRRGLVRHDDREALSAAIRLSASALNDAKVREAQLAAGEVRELTAMRAHNQQVAEARNDFVTVSNPMGNGGQVLSSPVAAHQMAVRGEKLATEKQKQRRNDDAAIAREALRNLAA